MEKPYLTWTQADVAKKLDVLLYEETVSNSVRNGYHMGFFKQFLQEILVIVVFGKTPAWSSDMVI